MHDSSVYEWLQWLEQFPFISGFEWTHAEKILWHQKMIENGIRYCFDTYGNVLIGETDRAKWFETIKSGRSLIVQSHLDHPGIEVTSVLQYEGVYRYMGLVRGGLSQNLVGRSLTPYVGGGQWGKPVVVDYDCRGIGDYFVSFESEAGSIQWLSPSHTNNELIVRHDSVEGWGLDNHLGCAVILDQLSRSPYAGVLGLLTLDEEIGMFGFKSFLSELSACDVSRKNVHILSLEVTREYSDQSFMVGGGARWRSADQQATFLNAHIASDAAVTWAPAVALTGGSCEAGYGIRQGWNATCLVVPCEYAHNGLWEGEWRAERVARSDVDLLIEQLGAFQIAFVDLEEKEQSRTHGSDSSSVPAIVNHVGDLKKWMTGDDYTSALRDLFPVWNNLHHRFGLNTIRFPQSHWRYWQGHLQSDIDWVAIVHTALNKWARSVREWLGCPEDSPLPDVHLFLGAPFNACNMKNGIALSIDKIQIDDCDRILCHELVHWFIGKKLDLKKLRPLEKTFIHEGLACLATMEIQGMNLERATGLSSDDVARYAECKKMLDSYWNDYLTGDLLAFSHRRHRVVRTKGHPHPFLMEKGGDVVKYGYWLAVACIQAHPMSVSISRWISETNLSEYIREYFQQKRRKYEGLPHSEQYQYERLEDGEQRPSA